ncbi:MAG: quinone-dependent dihydroorotate dehydrogenase [Polyangiales bacterium]
MYPLARRALFSLDAERAHELVGLGLRALHRAPALRALVRAAVAPPPDPRLAVRCLGLSFANPLGVAAGFDKDAVMYNALGALGFGAVEVGTVTALAQPGNPRPRLFRLPDDGALLNRMGFNNAGAEAAARSIEAHRPRGLVLGVNLGKSKAAPLELARDDYRESAARLGPLADYLVINVSSPNTPGLRALQSVEALEGVITAVREALAGRDVPLLVKIAPDLADEDVDAVADLAVSLGIAGVVATNTTVRRDGLRDPEAARALGDGGVSGAPVRARATAVVRRVHRRARGRLTVIGVGGVRDANDAWEKIAAGASLVQVYTGFVYEGPGAARRILEGLVTRMEREGVPELSSLVGAG